MKCFCKDWKPNLEKINNLMRIADNHPGYANIDPTPFTFCPWCGTKLKTDDAEPSNEMTLDTEG